MYFCYPCYPVEAGVAERESNASNWLRKASGSWAD